MDPGSPETWRWIWLGAAVVFSLGEMATPGAFFFLPFAAGALVASVMAFLGIAVAAEWVAFVAVSALVFGVLWPVGRRLDRRGTNHGVGANRWVGRQGVVVTDIPATVADTGVVRLEREQWRAQSGAGVPIRAGSTVLVTGVHGTRLVVLPLDEGPLSPLEPPARGSEQGAQ